MAEGILNNITKIWIMILIAVLFPIDGTLIDNFSVTNVKVKNLKFKPTMKGVSGGGIKVEVIGGSFEMVLDWSLAMVEEQYELIGNSSMRASGLDFAFNTKFSNDDGKPKFIVDNCHASIEKLDIQNEGGFEFSKDNVDGIRKSLESGICWIATEILNDNIEKSTFSQLLILSNTLLGVDFSLDEQYSAGLKITAKNKDEKQFKDTDSKENRMLNLQISEGVTNKALKIIFEDGVKFSFSMNFWEGLAAIFALKWIKPKGPFELKFHSPAPPTVSIMPTGFYTNLEGTVVINSKELGSESKSPLNISFSCAMVLDASMTTGPVKIKIKPVKVDLVLRSPGFNLTGVSKAVSDHFVKVFLPSISSDLEFDPGFLESVLQNYQYRSQAREHQVFE